MGRLTNFTKVNGNLRIELNDAGKSELPDLIEKYENYETQIFHDLIEYHLCNGWENVPAEDIGALTACPWILTDDIERDDTTNSIIKLGRVYWHQNYMVESTIEQLLTKGYVIFQGCD